MGNMPQTPGLRRPHSAKARTSSIACSTLCRRQSLGALSRVSDNSSGKTYGSGFGRASLAADFGKISVICRQAMQQNVLVIVRENDHLTRVGRHDDAPPQLVDKPVRLMR